MIDTSKDWKSRWFFIRLKDLKVDWDFPIIWHKTSLINSWKVVTRWNQVDQHILDLIYNTLLINMKKFYKVDLKRIGILEALCENFNVAFSLYLSYL